MIYDVVNVLYVLTLFDIFYQHFFIVLVDSNKESFVQCCSSCINEVSKFLSSQCVNEDFRYGISNHLSASLYAITAGLFHQDITSPESYPTSSLSRVSDIADDGMTTSTPYNILLADDNSRHQFSPMYSIYTLNSTWPELHGLQIILNIPRIQQTSIWKVLAVTLVLTVRLLTLQYGNPGDICKIILTLFICYLYCL